MRPLSLLLLLAWSICSLSPAAAQSRLVTRWASAVRADNVLPEYPRPQMARHAWQNLNGLWDYAITDSGAARPSRFDGKILVPFAVESRLSRVMRAVTDSQHLWYHRVFRVPSVRHDRRLLLHFGAVDWETTVYVNGHDVGSHRGGYDPFTFDITDAVRSSGRQDLVVRVWDPTDRGPQPRGKQVLKPEGIWYTAVTGIWQTVWLEPVPMTYLAGMHLVPDVDRQTLGVRVWTAGDSAPGGLRLEVLDKGRLVARASGESDDSLIVPIPAPHLWTPDDPHLYGLKIRLASGDSVVSYFGMRKITVGPDSAGVLRLLLNNHPLFEFGPLDQGWWPDGLYTAPSDAALRFDIVTTRRLGFNLARKHVKVEPERWYFLCDSLGLLVWQDMPSGDNNTPAAVRDFDVELEHVVTALRNHPSIVMWVPFNEGWGQHDTEREVAWLKHYDPTRLVNNASGWTDKGVGDVVDLHAYPGPGIPAPDEHRARVLGEFGGLGLPLPGHLWIDQDNWGYRSYHTRAELGRAYRDLMFQLRFLIGDGLAAAVYTQTTDVQIEVNGLLTYDRRVVKLPADAIAANQRLYRPPPPVRVILPTSLDTGQSWRYTTTAPDSSWYLPEFPDRDWREGPGGFGRQGTPGAEIRTRWETSDIWIRRSFELPDQPLVNPYLRVHHDEDAEVYLNGSLVGRYAGWTSSYVRVPLGRAAAVLHPGRNQIAVHVHQTEGGQYIDVGIDEILGR